jgi:carbamoylphosphate synthase large subunit
MNTLKILITSVGSLVGQNILDALEGRRKHVTIIGLNSIAESQRIYRCDRAYMVPDTSSSEFYETFKNIVQNENPDLIVAGRDIDVVFLSHYKEKEVASTSLIPVGKSSLAEMMLDKFETHRFAVQHNLPFAATLLYRNAQDTEMLMAFIEIFGFPLLVKPRQGFGSSNVYIITNQRHVDQLLQNSGEVLFQEYLSPAEDLDILEAQLTKGIPLSFQIPIHDHMVSQVIISRGGTIIDYLSTKQSLVMGRTEYARIYNEPSLNQMIELYAHTLAERGWWGFLNIQSRRDRFGNWKVFELNPRMSGATSTRLNLGLDELGLLLHDEKPEWNFPIITNTSSRQNHIFKYLTDYCVKDSDIEQFKQKGFWSKI